VSVTDPKQKIAYEFNERDFKVEWYSGTGSGGQHRNKHQNSCRLTHLPTGAVATAQCRSRENSLEEAKAALLKKLNDKANGEQDLAIFNEKRAQAGSGERGDKVRTYRFQDNTVRDHKTNKNAACDRVMQGNFHLLW
jgi:peptide chain release factor 1